MPSQEVVGIIPVRYASTRFPGKPLAKIGKKTLIQHTYENAKKCAALTKLVIATDDARIYDHAKSFGATCVMTPIDCVNGTERLAKAVEASKDLQNAAILINIQGDEPCLQIDAITDVIQLFRLYPDAVMTTAVVPSNSIEELLNPSIPKCVFNQKNEALYFSRSPVPYFNRDGYTDISGFLHLGLYGYRRDFLFTYASLPNTPLQQQESLEQLKVLEHGYKIHVAVVKDRAMGVDTPEDIAKVEKYLCL